MTADPGRVPMPDDPGLLENWARVGEMHDRYDAEMAYALKSQSHLWAVMSMYKLTEPEVRAMVESLEANELRRSAVPTASSDRILSVTVGCYICEQELTKQIADRRCPGEPK